MPISRLVRSQNGTDTRADACTIAWTGVGATGTPSATSGHGSLRGRERGDAGHGWHLKLRRLRSARWAFLAQTCPVESRALVVVDDVKRAPAAVLGGPELVL